MKNPLPLTRDELIKDLRQRGFRLTPQRERIIEIFFELPEGEHLSAEDLYHLLQKANIDASLATSYRTLKLLASVGVLRELDFAEDHKHYELARNPDSPHHHIICVDSGATDEFESPEVVELVNQMVQERNLELVDIQLKVFVRCTHPECAGEEDTESFGGSSHRRKYPSRLVYDEKKENSPS